MRTRDLPEIVVIAQVTHTTEIENDCVGICEKFRNAGIPFQVLQHAQQLHKQVDTHFSIEILRRFREQAEELIKQGQIDSSDTKEDQRVMGVTAGE